MLMNRWRVGTLTMGLVLVALGAMMLVSLITDINLLDTILTLWPIILISLGVEILLHLFIKKDADVKVRYDILSIIFIGAILTVSVCFYFLTFSIELFGSRENMYTAFGIRNDSVYFEDSVELAEANELVVFNGLGSLTVISTQDKNISVDYNITLNTNNREFAESIIGETLSFKQGERAYMMSNAPMYNDHRIDYPRINCVIYLPQDKTLNLSQYYGHIEYDSILEGQIIRDSD